MLVSIEEMELSGHISYDISQCTPVIPLCPGKAGSLGHEQCIPRLDCSRNENVGNPSSLYNLSPSLHVPLLRHAISSPDPHVTAAAVVMNEAMGASIVTIGSSVVGCFIVMDGGCGQFQSRLVVISD